MSAERLREAAALMRKRVEAATSSPWESGPWTDHAHDAAPVVMGGHGCYIVAEVGGPDAAHIASWHPAVALAVADWLDFEARTAERAAEQYPSGIWDVDEHALAVAAAYLGSTS